MHGATGPGWRPVTTLADPGVATRRAAIDALVRIDADGAYANLLVPSLLARRQLDERDRAFVTELVYGTTRMMRACDHLVDRFVIGEVEPQIRAALRVGAYQLHYLDTPQHAAVSATVGAVRGRARGLVNAVLRKVASAPLEFPDTATRLSYPDWINRRLVADLGPADALVAMEAMNEPAAVVTRADGYVQDDASQRIVAEVGAAEGHRVVDLCAAPGGKATGLASAGASVLAADLQPHRARLVADNATRLGTAVTTVVADGRHPPIRPGSADRVLIDAPCSGLGSLRRRPDARWRVDAAAPERLAGLQVELVRSGLELLAPKGELLYSVCTLTRAESDDVLAAVASDPRVEVVSGVERLLPVVSDGMAWFRLRLRPR